MATRNNRPAIKSYRGQKDAAGLKALMAANRRAQELARAAYLKAHPEFIACIVETCQGLVGPNYQRQGPDGPWGLCPRRDFHAKAMPEVFAPKNVA